MSSVRVEAFDNFVLDQDGVLYHGTQPIDGSLETVARLQQAGKRVFFATNNSTRSRAEVAARLSAHGISAPPEAVLTSAAAAANHLDAMLPAKQRRVLVVGEAGLVTELQAVGCVADTCPVGEVSLRDAAFAALFAPNAMRYDAVVVGYDGAFTTAKLARASAAVQRGAKLVGTNPDAGDACGDGIFPGAGALIAAVEAATGVRAFVVGKPAPQMLTQLLQRHSLDPGRTLMVGDRLDTDIAFGTAGGVHTCLVLTGVATAEQAAALPPGDARKPTHVLKSLSELQF